MSIQMSLKHKERLSRRLPKTAEGQAVKLHAQLVGEVIWAWNDLHKSFAMLFNNVVKTENPVIAGAVWAAVGSDRTQREMLAAAIRAHFTDKSRYGKRVLWALKAADKLAVYRNDVTHVYTGYTLEPKRLVVSPGYFAVSFNRIVRLSKTDLERLLRTLRGDILQLSSYAMCILWSAREKDPIKVPRKPRLRTPELFKL